MKQIVVFLSIFICVSCSTTAQNKKQNEKPIEVKNMKKPKQNGRKF